MINKIDKTVAGVSVDDELWSDLGSAEFGLRHDRYMTLEVWTGPGSTGTQLILDTDYEERDQDATLTSEVGTDVFAKVAIINATYEIGELYFSYLAVADVVEAQDGNDSLNSALSLEELADPLDAGVFVSFDPIGKLIIADKEYSTNIEVVGFLEQDGVAGQMVDVRKRGIAEGFTGLTKGKPCFLGAAGTVIQDTDLISAGQYRVYLGIAVDAATIDLNIAEAIQNATGSFEVEEHDTGWVACSDWTNQTLGDSVGGNVYHGLESPLRDLDIVLVISTDGSDDNSFLVDVNFQAPTPYTTQYGVSFWAVDSNSFTIQTARNGIDLVDTPSGDVIRIDTEAWFYRVMVRRKVDKIIKYVSEPVSEHDTGWVVCNDWTDQHFGDTVGADLVHGFNTNLRDLDVLLLHSILGQDSDSRVLGYDADYSDTVSGTLSLGFTINQIDSNSLRIQTGNNGINYINDSGVPVGCANGEYYRIIVRKATEKIVRHVEEPEYASFEFETGWIANSDWTDVHLGNTPGANLVHGLDADLSDLEIEVLLSTDGTDANSFSIGQTEHSTTGNVQTGVTYYQIDTDTIKVQTGVNGINYLDDGGFIIRIADADALYYKIVVRRRTETVHRYIYEEEPETPAFIHETGWVQCNEWTNTYLGDTVGANVNHGLNTPLRNLEVAIQFSELGQDSGSLEIVYTDSATVSRGLSIFQVDLDNIKIQTGGATDPIVYIGDGTGLGVVVPDGWYYNIVVRKRSDTIVRHITEDEDPAFIYKTGWVQCNDWTNQLLGDTQGSNVNHGLNTAISDLEVAVLWSALGQESDAIQIGSNSLYIAAMYGAEVQAVDNNNVKVQTGQNGVAYLSGIGAAGYPSNGEYYQIVVRKRSETIHRYIYEEEPEDPAFIHKTGWVACSVWTDQQLGDTLGGNVNHGLGVALSDLEVQILISELGQDSDSLEISSIALGSVIGSDIDTGLTIFQVDSDTVLVQTGDQGVYFIGQNGDRHLLDVEAWYYQIVVRKRSQTIVRTVSVDGGKPLLHVQDVKAYNVAGGTFTAGADQTRDLNSVVTNEISGAGLSANQITLPSGTYDVEWFVPSYSTGPHFSSLYDVTHAQALAKGQTAYSPGSGSVTHSMGNGRIVLSETSVLEIRHRCGATKATDGFGVNTNVVGYDSIYTDVQIRRLDP